VAGYNARRIEITNENPITAFQIQLQMAHRLAAVLIALTVAACAWISRRAGAPTRRLCWGWCVLILIQAALGAATVLTNKAADVATAHVLVGALSLGVGVILSLVSACNREAMVLSEMSSGAGSDDRLTAHVLSAR
jgi:cytochrome c oxidase assembly protein subunit 15